MPKPTSQAPIERPSEVAERDIGIHTGPGMTMASVNAAKEAQVAESRMGVAARVILVEARKKGDKAHANVQRVLQALLNDVVMSEERRLRERETKERSSYIASIAERVVCGFIAEVDMAQQQHRGLPREMVWNLNSFTVTKIVDALNKAGYHSNGYRDPVRE